MDTVLHGPWCPPRFLRTTVIFFHVCSSVTSSTMLGALTRSPGGCGPELPQRTKAVRTPSPSQPPCRDTTIRFLLPALQWPGFVILLFPQVHQRKGKERAGSAYTQLASIRAHTDAEQESKTGPCGPTAVAGYGEAVPMSFII